MAKRTSNNTILYNKSINLNSIEDVAGSKVKDAIHKVKHCDPPSTGWLNWNTVASRLETRHTTKISYVCRYNIGRVWYSDGRMDVDYPIPLVKTLPIREAVVTIVQDIQLIVESNSLITTQAMKEDIKSPSQILNLIEDIIVLVKAVENIKLLYCNTSINKLVDKMLKRPILIVLKRLFIMNEASFFLLFQKRKKQRDCKYSKNKKVEPVVKKKKKISFYLLFFFELVSIA